MKKILLILAVTISCSVASAQTDTYERSKATLTKSGRKILPQAGDFSIGIDATPMFKYLGNMLNHSTANDAQDLFGANESQVNTVSSKIAQTIFAKYFLKDDAAIRARLNINCGSFSETTTAAKNGSTTGATVNNSATTSSRGFALDLGYEMRRGYGRLQGFFGPQVGLGFGGGTTSYKYGNPLTTKYNSGEAPRTLSDSHGHFAFTFGGFAGVEYFVLPKVSLAGEVNCNLGYRSNGKNTLKTESWDTTKDEDGYMAKTIKTGGSNNFNFLTSYSGAISVNFYF